MLYSQPDFYHFSEASTNLAKTVIKTDESIDELCDLFAGCGVIGLEIMSKLEVKNCTFIEKNTKFKKHLYKNCRGQNPERLSFYFEDINKLVVENRFSHIVFNPPFYLFHEGRLPQNPDKIQCHFIDLKEITFFFRNRIEELLRDKGFFYTVLGDSMLKLMQENLSKNLQIISVEGNENYSVVVGKKLPV